MEQPSPTYWDDAAHPRHSPGPGPPARHHQHHDSRLTPQPEHGHAVHVPVGPSSEAGGRLPEDQSIFHYCEGNLNFSTAHSEDDEYFHKRKLSRDPMSHRIIEKRRRDRMNNCLADLSRLIPAEYLKKGRGRVEKTEIIEMAIKHMQYLQSRANLAAGIDCVAAPHLPGDLRVTKCEQSPGSDRDVTPLSEAPATPPPNGLGADPTGAIRPVVRPIVTEHYRLGYQECLSEAMHFLVEVEGYFAGDSLCVKLISHLQKHCDKIVKGDRLNFPRTRQPGETTSSSGSSSSYGAAGGSASASKQGQCASQTSQTSQSSGTEESSASHAAAHTQASQASHPRGAASSQLRDMLCASPPSPSASQPSYHVDAMGHHGHHGLPQHYETCTERCGERCGDDDGPEAPRRDAHSPHHPYVDAHSAHSPHPDAMGHHHSYKFKNNIKQRFCEEHSNVGGHKRRRTVTRSPPPSPSATPTPSQPSQHAASSHQTQASVPIFVLHTKGSFYIPLTVSCEALAPYLDVDLLSDTASSHTNSGPMALGLVSSATPSGMVLHPVTISVNFQQYWKPSPQTPHCHPHAPVAALPPPPPPAAAAQALALPPQTSHIPNPAHAWSRHGHGHGAADAAVPAVAFYPSPSSPWEMCAGRT
ncbi:transcription factor cwo-like isoform X2 [Thrips palmi]|uniref:Transcription factor cwo-like isoform X2 n=1 Tax=Thrips palmi TaxID=161013 RepID=A0A6P8Y2C8_THRPL|nr:transcription factor cwo-like isoform X2 [Thrips palmi]